MTCLLTDLKRSFTPPGGGGEGEGVLSKPPPPEGPAILGPTNRILFEKALKKIMGPLFLGPLDPEWSGADPTPSPDV